MILNKQFKTMKSTPGCQISSHSSYSVSRMPLSSDMSTLCQSASPSTITEPLESLGDSITTAVLLSWSKEIGDSVKEDDVIAIVETDKVRHLHIFQKNIPRK